MVDTFLKSCAAWLVAGLASVLLAAVPVAGNSNDDGDADEAREREKQTLLGFVSASNLSLEQRRDAARSLLDKEWADADDALAGLIEAGESETTTRAVAQALSRRLPPTPAVFAGPLLEAIGDAEDDLLDDLAHALGRIEDREVQRRVSELARDSDAEEQTRRGAILALAVQRTKANAGTLIGIMQEDAPEAVHEAVFESLARLTGNREYGEDAGRWLEWWRRIQHATEAHWYASLIEHHARRNAELDESASRLKEQLLSTRRQLFWTTPAQQRQVYLARLLEDEMEATRRLALELAGQLLLTPGLIGQELRKALVASLEDVSPTVRQGAAELLADLVDAEAAKVVAERLKEGEEGNANVRAAYLLVLERIPMAEAVEPMIDLLDDEVTRDRAAAALMRAFDNDKVEEGIHDRLRAKVYERIDANGGSPRPRLIELLARVGDEDDWERIVAWLDHDEASVRRAAAQALADSHRGLRPLAERSGDPEIQSVLYAAARSRGRDPRAFAALIEHRPEGNAQRDAWRSALVAMAGRVGTEAVLEGVAALREREGAGASGQAGVRRSLKLDMLSAAIEAARPNDTALSALSEDERVAWAKLALARGRVYLAAGRAEEAAAAMREIGEVEALLTGSQRRQRELVLIGAKLEVESVTAAARRAEALLEDVDEEDAGRYRDELLDVFATVAERLAGNERKPRGQEVYERLKSLLGAEPSERQQRRLAALEELLQPADVIGDEAEGEEDTEPVTTDGEGDEQAAGQRMGNDGDEDGGA